MDLIINSKFECGNIEFISQQGNVFELKINHDSLAHYNQWFYFTVTGMANQACQFKILKASESSYPDGWDGYQAVASYDRKHWFRVPGHYQNGVYVIDHMPEQALIYYAYFAPYSYEDYLNWLGNIQEKCQVEPLAITHDGRLLHLLQIGDAANAKYKCWFIARQHSGEAMASWFVEALVQHLLDETDKVIQELLPQTVFYIVPMMNPDGVVRGNLRANSQGLDLNRQWLQPDLNRCPEVYHTRQKMRETGVDFFLDIHGDETLPYVFLANSADNVNHSLRQQHLEDIFRDNLLEFSSDFQVKYGYEKAHFTESTPTLACNHVAEYFDCLSFTLEMPFKDNANAPDAFYGWSPERCAKLSRPVLQALHKMIDKLR